MSKVLIIGEADGERIRESTLELVTLGREVASAAGWELLAAVPGGAPAAAAEDLARRAGCPVQAVTHPLLGDYTADGWVAALAQLIDAESPALVLTTHGPQGWDFAPRLAARCGGTPATECTSIERDADGLVLTRKVFNGKLELRFRLSGSPVVATVQRGSRPAVEDAAEPGAVTSVTPDLGDENLRGRFVAIRAGGGGKVDLTQAEVIVAGGRALGGAEKFEIVQELATALGGQVGASRPVTDAGWLPPEHQVGSSGVTVKPKLYIACGISGAIQHLVGMKAADFIIAINKDPKAPIFEAAHVGVVGDLFDVVPALTAAVKDARAR